MASSRDSSRQGNEYGDTINYGTLHQGNNYYSYATPKLNCRDQILLTDPVIHRETLKSEKGRRASGTCEWIRENEAYKSWLDGNDNCLWICGGPGKGKTMLSIFLTEELESDRSRDITLFFFCINGDKDRNNATAVLRGLAYQLLTKDPNLSKYVSSYFETSKTSKNTLSSPATLWMMFTELLQAPELGTVYCVLDGLDECDEASIENLIRQFRDFYSASEDARRTTRNFKLTIVSRKVNGLHIFPQVRLDPDNENRINEDIKQFISIRMQELSHLSGFNDGFRRDIEDTLLSRSEGTFLWVGFVMYELLNRATCEEVINVLESLPRGLPAMYSRMLKQIKSSQRRILSAILMCVTIAPRPMAPEELKIVISLLCNTSIPSNQIMRDRIASCGPILQASNGQVGLVHQSARDYLLREEIDKDPVLEEFRINAGKAHASLATICLDYIEKSGFGQQRLYLGDPSLLQQSPLLEYAAMHWPEHARRSLFTDEDVIVNLSRPFFRNRSGMWKHWWPAYTIYANLPWDVPPDDSPLLHIASYLGIDSLARKLLTKNGQLWNWLQDSANQKIASGRTALMFAAGRGHQTMVQLLLANGADVNLEDTYGGTALTKAAKTGQEGTAQLLLANGADAKNPSALLSAAQNGHLAVVELLLASGADAKNCAALELAAQHGHLAVVELLLADGA
ncbi:hypothetical protein V8C42DRAFT_335705 [Trichoderma barbatum]